MQCRKENLNMGATMFLISTSISIAFICFAFAVAMADPLANADAEALNPKLLGSLVGK